MKNGDTVMCGSIPAVVKCAEPDGDGNVVVALQRETGFFYTAVLPTSLSAPELVVIAGVEYVADVTNGTLTPKSPPGLSA
jgi:hypothetical protein